MAEDKDINVQPGPWGIGKDEKTGKMAINFDHLKLLDQSGKQRVAVLPNGEKLVVPEEIKRVNVNSAEKVKI